MSSLFSRILEWRREPIPFAIPFREYILFVWRLSKDDKSNDHINKYHFQLTVTHYCKVGYRVGTNRRSNFCIRHQRITPHFQDVDAPLLYLCLFHDLFSSIRNFFFDILPNLSTQESVFALPK
jgi:hypothetical protein